jgi:hypothetical protein
MVGVGDLAQVRFDEKSAEAAPPAKLGPFDLRL